jgi:hypothetical protein
MQTGQTTIELDADVVREIRIALADRQIALTADLRHPNPTIRAIAQRQMDRVNAALSAVIAALRE